MKAASILKSRNLGIRSPGLIKATISRTADYVMLAIPLCFMAVTAALENIHPAYSRVANTISELVWGPYGWLETVLFCAFGLMLVVFAWKLHNAVESRFSAKIGVSALALMGLAFFIIAIFPTEAPGTAETLPSLIHEHTAQAIAFLFPIACFLLLPGLKNGGAFPHLYASTFIAGAAGLILNIVGLVCVVGDGSWLGAIERAVMLNGIVWLGIIGYGLVSCRKQDNKTVKAGRISAGSANLRPAPVACCQNGIDTLSKR